MMNANEIDSGHHFTVCVTQSSMLYTNFQSGVGPLYLNETGEK